MSTVAATADRIGRASAPLLVGALLVGAIMIGFAVTHDPRLGVLAAGGAVYACFLLLDLPVAVAIWIVALYLAGVPGTNGAPTGTTVLLAVGCTGAYVAHRRGGRPVPTAVRWAYASAALMVLWSATTIVWAPDQAVAIEFVRYLAVAAIAMPIVVSSVSRPRDVLVMAMAFVAGASLLIVAGVVLGSNVAPTDKIAAAEAAAGRLHAGITDPNYLAADIVAALALTAGLLGVHELRAWRPVLLLAIPVLLYGLVATQSRGGFIAAFAAVLLAAALMRGYRGPILLGISAVAALLTAFLLAQPRAFERLTQDDATGTGRTEIWRMSVSVARDHLAGGVGTGNFRVVQGSYINHLGFVEFPATFVDTPMVTHNILLQALVENGLPGLLLQIALLVACVTASFVAAQRFARLGRPDLANLGRALAVGQISSLVASTFIANGNDRVLWVLLALGPALLVGAATAQRRSAAPRSPCG